MSVFNYSTKSDPYDGLRRDVYNIKRTLKAMTLWVVNDISLGVNVLRRRQIRPAPDSGSLFKGPWFDFTGVSGISNGGGGGSGGSVGTANYSDYAFGFATPTTAVVSVNAGRVRHGTRTAVAVATAPITIVDEVNKTYVYVAYTFGGSGTITSSTTEPVSTETIYNHVLHEWLLIGGKATLQKICSLGDISIPSAYG